MPITPVKIPQNVYIEDRIVGPLTLRQVIIITVGGGFSYMLFSMLQKTYGSVPLALGIIAWVPCAVAVLFAIVKINDLSLMRICLLIIEKMHKAPVRTWAPRRGISINIRMAPAATHEAPSPVTAEHQTSIQELSSMVDRLPVGVPVAAPAETVKQTLMPTSVTSDTSVTSAPPSTDTTPDTTEPSAEPRPRFPVDPSRVKVDTPASPSQGGPSLSDLSVFRDVFPHDSSQTPWH
jgi:hypothetical protein